MDLRGRAPLRNLGAVSARDQISRRSRRGDSGKAIWTGGAILVIANNPKMVTLIGVLLLVEYLQRLRSEPQPLRSTFWSAEPALVVINQCDEPFTG